MNESYTDEENKRIRDARISAYRDIMSEQFLLTYIGKISFEASDRMSVFDRRTMYSILLERKEAERKADEEALKKMKSNNTSSPKRFHHR